MVSSFRSVQGNKFLLSFFMLHSSSSSSSSTLWKLFSSTLSKFQSAFEIKKKNYFEYDILWIIKDTFTYQINLQWKTNWLPKKKSKMKRHFLKAAQVALMSLKCVTSNSVTRFGDMLPLWLFFSVDLVFSKILQILWYSLYAIWQIFSVVNNVQHRANNLSILSHWY